MRIDVKQIKLYAYHGCLPEEAVIGSHYEIDLSVITSDEQSSLSDELSETIDYVLLTKIATEEMAIRSRLLETVARRILERIWKEAPTSDFAEVSLSKLSPPVEGDVARVTVVFSGSRQ